MKKIFFIATVLFTLSNCSSSKQASQTVANNRIPAGVFGADQRECIQKLNPSAISKFQGAGEQFLEIPEVKDGDPKGLYLVGQTKSLFLSTPKRFMSLEVPESSEPQASKKQYFVEIIPVPSPHLKNVGFKNFHINSVAQSCESSNTKCPLQNASKWIRPFKDIELGQAEAIDAMNVYIVKMLPGAVRQVMTQEQERIMLSQDFNENARNQLLSKLPKGVAEGLEACKRAVPYLQATVEAEQKILAQYEPGSEESPARNTASVIEGLEE